MKKEKSKVKKFRIPLPLKRNQAFKRKVDYDRKNKDWKKDSGSFCF